jgi:hypothetical protein
LNIPSLIYIAFESSKVVQALETTRIRSAHLDGTDAVVLGVLGLGVERLVLRSSPSLRIFRGRSMSPRRDFLPLPSAFSKQ